MSGQQVLAWERGTAPVLIVAAAVFLAAYAWPILDPSLPVAARRLCTAIPATVWLALAADLGLRLAWSERRLRFLRQNWMDVATRRCAHASTHASAARRSGTEHPHEARPTVRSRAGRGHGGVRDPRRVRGVAGGFGRGASPLGVNITTFSDATWWAATTVTTVGYGDRYPVTSQGRLVAVALMITCIALLGVITAAITRRNPRPRTLKPGIASSLVILPGAGGAMGPHS